eukprot:65428-Rhodomonas_salina.1
MSTQDFVNALTLRHGQFQLETLELLIDSDRHGGIHTDPEFLMLRDRLTRHKKGTGRGNRAARAQTT